MWSEQIMFTGDLAILIDIFTQIQYNSFLYLLFLKDSLIFPQDQMLFSRKHIFEETLALHRN